MALSALGFNCLGTGANYHHLSLQTTAASVYTSVREVAAGGGRRRRRARPRTQKVTCPPASEVSGSAGGGREEEGEVLERLGRASAVFC